ncbi:hypothetical protein FRC07_007466 [Ceratobasidium sp. 392]|nr:hypothetical protein FRC07_007466 [Ceratobasidium sp. 392]
MLPDAVVLIATDATPQPLMKLSAVPAVFAAAAGLVSAAPVRIYVFTPKQRVPAPDVVPEWAQGIRWGHAAAPAFNFPALQTTAPSRTYPPYPTLPNPTDMYDPYMPNPTYMPTPTYAPYWTYGPNPTYLPNSMYLPTPTYVPYRTYVPNPTYLPNPTYRPIPTGFPAFGYPPTPDPIMIGLDERLKAQFRDGESHRGGCRMKGMRAKSLQWGNKLRVILGLPPIHPFQQPSFAVETLVDGNGRVIYRKEIPVNPLPTHHRHHMRPLHRRPSFMVRLNHALASLGPWEGRAVSFVLGCGVLIVRSVRARRAERRIVLEDDSVIFVADIKEPVVVEALPAYAEKIEVEADTAPQTNNAH